MKRRRKTPRREAGDKPKKKHRAVIYRPSERWLKMQEGVGLFVRFARFDGDGG
ncbi:MAG: hypothetical protein AB7V14_00595 [Kiritimatiellia bacterium]